MSTKEDFTFITNGVKQVVSAADVNDASRHFAEQNEMLGINNLEDLMTRMAQLKQRLEIHNSKGDSVVSIHSPVIAQND